MAGDQLSHSALCKHPAFPAGLLKSHLPQKYADKLETNLQAGNEASAALYRLKRANELIMQVRRTSDRRGLSS